MLVRRNFKVISVKFTFCNSVAKAKCTLASLAFKTPGGRLEEYRGKKRGEGDQECKKMVCLLGRPRYGPKSFDT